MIRLVKTMIPCGKNQTRQAPALGVYVALARMICSLPCEPMGSFIAVNDALLG